MALRTNVALLSLFVLSACGSSKVDRTFDDPSAEPPAPGDGTGTPSQPFGGGSADGGATGDAGNDGCPPSATLVYVTGEGDQLYSFYPPTQSFTLIGKFNCLTSPTHMTVDRQGNAWVVAGGMLYKASTTDATCAAVPTWNINFAFSDFALTFIGVSNTVDNTLYLMNDAAGVGAFDIPSGNITTLGTADIASTLGDMTSNGDGTLYFLRDVASPTLYRLSPKDGTTITSSPIDATGGGSQALAFWGGLFYAFEDSAIFEYDPAKKTTTPKGNAPLQVTGAGQSTCVPLVAPPPK
jgi:hypothetical protein